MLVYPSLGAGEIGSGFIVRRSPNDLLVSHIIFPWACFDLPSVGLLSRPRALVFGGVAMRGNSLPPQAQPGGRSGAEIHPAGEEAEWWTELPPLSGNWRTCPVAIVRTEKRSSSCHFSGNFPEKLLERPVSLY